MAAYLETAVEIAREAGALLANLFEKRIGFELKGDYDLVTAADRASEKLIVERIGTHFPSHSIVAEEGGGHESGGEFRWYVDPLDGTTNFAHGYPLFNVTLALEKAGELIAGVVYDPIRQEMFATELGGGAYLNNRRIHVSKGERLTDSLLITGFPSFKRHQSINVHFFHQVAMTTHGVRRSGSAALDLAWVSAGRADGFWEFGLKPWDMAAGILLVEEAGGRCTDMHSAPRSLQGPHLVATNGRIHDETIGLFGEVFAGQYRVPLQQINPS